MGTLLLFLGIVLVGAYVSFGLVLLFMQSRFLYRPVRDIAFTPADLDLDFEEVAFQSDDDVALTGWFVPAPKARSTVLFCHGNGGNIMHRLDTQNLLQGMGLSCFVFDYRGYGQSEGKPTESGTYLDARAAYDWLTKTRGIPADQIVIFGRSLGGSIATHLAGRVPTRGLVIESTFTSYPDIGAKFYPYMPVRLFARYRYNTRNHLSRVRCPVLVMHSPDDELVPFEFGTQLFDTANEPKQFVKLIGGHNDGFLVSGDLYKDAWSRWLDSLGDARSEGAAHRAS